MQIDRSDIAVSIFCNTYNQEKYIKNALDSFLHQKTSFPFEIIVHDDASTDSTPAIIREYVKNYPHLIKPIFESINQYSQGIKFVKTKMIPLAKGQYIAFCEGDDFWIDENKLQKQYDAITKNPNVSFVVGKVLGCEEDGLITDIVCPSKDLNFAKTGVYSKDLIGNLIANAKYPFQTSCFFASKNLFFECYEREFSKFTHGDEALLREGVIEGDFYYINEPLSCRRLNSLGSFTLRKIGFPLFQKKKNILYHQYANMLFDIHTNGAYRKTIRKHIVSDFTSGYVDKKTFNKIRFFYDITAFEILKNSGFRKYCIFIMTILFPRVLSLFDKIRLK